MQVIHQLILNQFGIRFLHMKVPTSYATPSSDIPCYYPTAVNTVQIIIQIYSNICTVENLFCSTGRHAGKTVILSLFIEIYVHVSLMRHLKFLSTHTSL